MCVSANTITVETTNTTIVMNCETAGRIIEVIETKVDETDEVVRVQETEIEDVAGLDLVKGDLDPVRGQERDNDVGIVTVIAIVHLDVIVIEIEIATVTETVIGIVTEEIGIATKIVNEIVENVPQTGKSTFKFLVKA